MDVKIFLKYIVVIIGMIPIINYAECNHSLIKNEARLACVNVTNKGNKKISVTSLDHGFTIGQNQSNKSMLLLGAMDYNIKVTPIPYQQGYDKLLVCQFNIDEARQYDISIIYKGGNNYIIKPQQFTALCHLEK